MEFWQRHTCSGDDASEDTVVFDIWKAYLVGTNKLIMCNAIPPNSDFMTEVFTNEQLVSFINLFTQLRFQVI